MLLSNCVEYKAVTLGFAGLPRELQGLRIAHVTDLHIRKPRPRHEEVLDFLIADTPDLIAITGDVMHRPQHEPAALDLLRQLVDRVSPRFGYVGCFGNHDSGAFKRQAGELPIMWLIDQAMAHPDLPMIVGGVDCQYQKKTSGDALKMGLSMEGLPRDRFRLGLAHIPRWLPALSAMGFDLVLSGHTHGGQVRLPGGRPLYNATRDWPLDLTSGVIRMNRTTLVISRGLGESARQGLRICCRPMLVMMTLTEGAGETAASPRAIEPW